MPSSQAVFSRVIISLLLFLLASTPNAWAAGAQDQFAAGFDLIKSGKLKDAVGRFKAGLKAEPDNAMAHFYLGEAYLGLSETDKAKAHYEKALKLEPFGSTGKDAKARLAQLGGGEKVQEPAPGSVWTETTTGMEFVWVPSGCFVMGSGDGENNERPPHKVCVKGFYLGRYEVTVHQYRLLTGKNPSDSEGDSHPVREVSWGEAKSYTDELAFRSGQNIRLPSEAEWEYACRGGQQTEFCGRGSIDQLAWYYNSKGGPRSVGQKRANAYGLYDMSGNVEEWVEDCYNNSYNGAPTDGSAWTTGDCSSRVSRGGSWIIAASWVRSAKRNWHESWKRNHEVGFRVARALP